MDKQVTCPHCGNMSEQHKYGKNRSGTARFKCRACGKIHTPKPAKLAYSAEERAAAIKTYYEGVSGRAVGRLLGMSKANVFRWIKARAANVPPPDPATAENTAEAIELDELF
jgi:transposase-like protein